MAFSEEMRRVYAEYKDSETEFYIQQQGAPAVSKMAIEHSKSDPHLLLPYDATASIRIPMELYDNHNDAIYEMLQMLDADGKDSDEQYEVILGVNDPWPDAGEHVDLADKISRFSEITDSLHHILPHSDTVLWSAFLTGIPKRTMNRVMRKLTAVSAEDLVSLSRPLSFPVLRFDCDGKGEIDINKPSTGVAAIDALAKAVRAGEAHLVKMHTSFVPLYAQNGFLPQTAPKRVTAFYSLAKDMLESTLGPYDERIYHEESASGVQLGSLLRVQTIMNRNPERYGGTDGENRLFLEIAAEILDDDTPLFKYLPRSVAVHITSARRIEQLARQHPPQEIPLLEYGDDYKTYTDLVKEKRDTSVRQETLEEILTMIGVILLRQEKACGHPVDFTKEDVVLLQSRMQTHYFPEQSMFPYDNWVNEARRLGDMCLCASGFAA